MIVVYKLLARQFVFEVNNFFGCNVQKHFDGYSELDRVVTLALVSVTLRIIFICKNMYEEVFWKWNVRCWVFIFGKLLLTGSRAFNENVLAKDIGTVLFFFISLLSQRWKHCFIRSRIQKTIKIRNTKKCYCRSLQQKYDMLMNYSCSFFKMRDIFVNVAHIETSTYTDWIGKCLNIGIMILCMKMEILIYKFAIQ